MTITVVIPAYNGSRFIEQAILSVLNQERRPDEILVCDDNSADNTLAICAQYDGYLSICTNPDGPSGFVNSWNKAIARARGDYISILHQDDILAPEFIRVGVRALENNPDVRHLFSTCRYIDEKGNILSYSFDGSAPAPGTFTSSLIGATMVRLTGPEYVRSYQSQGYPHIHRCPGVITHRSIFEECRYEPSAGHIADDDFFYRVGMFTDVIGILTPLASFRIHSGSVTGHMDDAELVAKLMDDYVYQCRQWKDHPFLNEVTYGYFIRNAHKYIRRYIGYGIRRKNVSMIARGMRQWRALYRMLHLERKDQG